MVWTLPHMKFCYFQESGEDNWVPLPIIIMHIISSFPQRLLNCYYIILLCYDIILVGIKFGSWAPNHHCKEILVIVIARGQEFMAVNRPESEGIARGQGRFTLP